MHACIGLGSDVDHGAIVFDDGFADRAYDRFELITETFANDTDVLTELTIFLVCVVGT